MMGSNIGYYMNGFKFMKCEMRHTMFMIGPEWMGSNIGYYINGFIEQ